MKPVLPKPFAALAAAILLGGCAAQSAAPALEIAQPAPAFQAYSVSAAEPEVPAADPMLEKYVDVLEGIYYDSVLPDGQRLEPFEDSAENLPNEFAVFDVDGDGEEELIVRYINTCSAGMFGAVFGYDCAEGKLTTQLVEYPAMTFFANGTVEVGWSHNQGLSGRFWPSTFYQYDADADAYLPVACVDAWDGEFFPTSFDGEPFPAETDPNGNNIVYYIYLYGCDCQPEPVSQEEFDLWYNELIGFDPEQNSHTVAGLEIPYQPMTEENISALV